MFLFLAHTSLEEMVSDFHILVPHGPPYLLSLPPSQSLYISLSLSLFLSCDFIFNLFSSPNLLSISRSSCSLSVPLLLSFLSSCLFLVLGNLLFCLPFTILEDRFFFFRALYLICRVGRTAVPHNRAVWQALEANIYWLTASGIGARGAFLKIYCTYIGFLYVECQENVISYIECIMSYQTYFLYTINKSDGQRWFKGCHRCLFLSRGLCLKVTVHFSHCGWILHGQEGFAPGLASAFLQAVVLIPHGKSDDWGGKSAFPWTCHWWCSCYIGVDENN